MVIRLNSIGDIILTSPTVKNLFEAGFEVHYLLKKPYVALTENSPYIHKTWVYESELLIAHLKEEAFDYILDLHNTLRTKKIKFKLGHKNTFTFRKPRVKYWLMETFGLKIKPQKHVVERFNATLKPILNAVYNYPIEVFFPNLKKYPKSLPESYVVFVIGTAFFTKSIPLEKWLMLTKIITSPIVLIGGKNDVAMAIKVKEAHAESIIDLVGKTSLEESAQIIKHANYIVSGDTGMMHMASALGTDILAVFGSTHPNLGYTPYNVQQHKSYIIEDNKLNCRPCTKQGREGCPKGHFKCMKDLDLNMFEAGIKYLSE